MQKAKNGDSAHPATEADSSRPLSCVPPEAPLSILREAEVVVPGDGGLHGGTSNDLLSPSSDHYSTSTTPVTASPS